ncbi:hypothetical protein BVRB_4g076130 [Beta vulgaris subsp. vulgaris]|uniref:Uncharacterized protein n=1 Tax=Beta vulgaris subsp. vulgaris TaxID=3555 RepID=A0A0J8CL93_BETVV|nr:hypothetical protein BVRB_4g076130 [Beta vulgaris subsp. vulgaris]
MPIQANFGRRGLWWRRTSPQDKPRQGGEADHVSIVTVACLYKGGQTMCSGQVITIDPNQVLKVA